MARRTPTELLAGVTALVAWASLGVQLAILLNGMDLFQAAWRFAGYFTILTNLLVAVMATRIARGVERGISGPVARMALTSAILLVALAYWFLLAPLWTPTSWQLAADIGLHLATPVLAAALWFRMADGRLSWRDAPKAAIWPALYAAYALARGAGDGWYAYWFLNPKDQSDFELLLSVAGLSLLVMGVGAALVAIDRRRGPTT